MRENQQAIVKILLEVKDVKTNTVDVTLANTAGNTAFDEACRCGSRDVLDLLAEAGAKYGSAQLAIAAKNDCLSVAQWLVAHAVDVNGKNVMTQAKPKSATKRYLIGEGGVEDADDLGVEKGKEKKPAFSEPVKSREAMDKNEPSVCDVTNGNAK